MGVRLDGANVMQCQNCHMGFIELYPSNLDAYYSDIYYQGDGTQTEGYRDYDMTAAHSLTWVAYLIQLWVRSGAVLDVGCADGYLLNLISKEYQKYGIEVNSAMSDLCRSKGISIISGDIQEKSLPENFAGYFEIITGIAVLEHVSDMRLALEHIRDLLAIGGIFIFEVPLISNVNDNKVWYNSSLEHVFYPTVKGLEYVFNEVFGTPLVGGEVYIHEYGSTYVGLIARDENVYKRLELLYASLFVTPVRDLQTKEASTFRFLFDVVHRADTEQAYLLESLDQIFLSPAIITRLSMLWKRDVQLRNLYLTQGKEQAIRLEEARDYYASQAQNWQSIAEERNEVINKLMIARDYFASQAQNWQTIAEEHTNIMHQFEEARNFHDQQSQNWQQVVKEQSEHLTLLQDAVKYYTEQVQSWQQLAKGEKQKI